MSEKRAVPRYAESDCANDHLKGGFRSLFWGSMLLAVSVHFGLFAYSPEFTAQDFAVTSDELIAVEIPPEVEVPPPPEGLARPARPVIASIDIGEDVTISPTTFEMNPVEALAPPPAVKERVLGVEERPTFTPFTVAPEILNREELVRAMILNYPPTLKASGIGGVVQVYFFIDEEGVVRSTRISQGSGYEALDIAALEVAGMYRFSPALNRDERVPVWVSFPIRFQVVR